MAFSKLNTLVGPALEGDELELGEATALWLCGLVTIFGLTFSTGREGVEVAGKDLRLSGLVGEGVRGEEGESMVLDTVVGD